MLNAFKGGNSSVVSSHWQIFGVFSTFIRIEQQKQQILGIKPQPYVPKVKLAVAEAAQQYRAVLDLPARLRIDIVCPVFTF